MSLPPRRTYLPSRAWWSAGAASALALALAAGGTAGAAEPPDAARLAPYYSQHLDWHPCGKPASASSAAPAPTAGPALAPAPTAAPAPTSRPASARAAAVARERGFSCATVRVPRDYADPDGADIALSVARKPATGPGKRLGSLLLNPGGPGGSAVDFLTGYAGAHYPAAVRERYDLVGVDPRGVGHSAPVRCLDGPAMDRWAATDITPDDAAETAALRRSFHRFAEACRTRTGALLGHVSTPEAARDLDIVRAALGERRLDYAGASYGTYLGAVYAELFPRRVGRMILDGAMDPSIDARRLNLDQTTGFETAFRAFLRDCARHEDCPLPATAPAANRALAAFLTGLDRRPLRTGDGTRVLTEAQAATGVIAALYTEAAWPALRQALGEASGEKKDGTTLLSMSDAYYERGANGHYSSLMAANVAVNCLDAPPAFTGPAAVRAALPDFERASPVFGRALAWMSLTCADWPHPATGTPHRVTAPGAPPIVVVGTTRDPATPYRWARSLAGQLTSGRLLTYDGDGHTAYNRGSTCVDTTLTTYLLTGTPPALRTTCH
ncbi:alpha/beta hydrolase [Streptomyces sp. SPB074]|uniref:alpha/beta hydrolase n=1 Tax=Streptomyces sp. (strain SPB074) TaxID=465543 RepID=UPI00017F1AE1|nr:alpha/beta hydrolase [Streptomyces sp. SPB074]EDY43007.2 proteinase [Streptomyces sp. SPB074]